MSQNPHLRVHVYGQTNVILTRTPDELQVVAAALTKRDIPIQSIAPTVGICAHAEPEVIEALFASKITVAGHLPPQARVIEPTLDWEEITGYRPSEINAIIDQAIAQGRQVELYYFATYRNAEASTRVIDPWYVEDEVVSGWCHLRQAERSFVLSRVGSATLLSSPIMVEQPHEEEDGHQG